MEKAQCSMKNGDRYEGGWLGGKRSGKGRQMYAYGIDRGILYEGDWLNDQRCGKGHQTYWLGSVYDG